MPMGVHYYSSQLKNEAYEGERAVSVACSLFRAHFQLSLKLVFTTDLERRRSAPCTRVIPFDSCHFAVTSRNAPFGFARVFDDDQCSPGSRCGRLRHIYRRVAFNFKIWTSSCFVVLLFLLEVSGVTQAWNSLHHSLIQVYVPRGRMISMVFDNILLFTFF